MRIRSLMAGCVFAQIVCAADAPRPAAASRPPTIDFERRERIQQRANLVRPRRRDEPLRYENITDNEVREVQLVAAKILPRTIVNISPVVTGCPCEEGPDCTDQVYLVANSADKSYGLQLSRVRKRWIVGTVQRWWMRYNTLNKRETQMGHVEFEDSMNRLILEFPVCVGEAIPEPKLAGAGASRPTVPAKVEAKK